MKKFMKRLKNERGLTLVELLAVIVILSIISLVGFVYVGGIIENTKKDAHIANAQQAISAAKLYEATGGTIDDTNGVTIKTLQDNNYLDENMVDPWTKKPYKGDGAEAPDLIGTASKVTKNTDGEYVITFASSECTITEKSEVDLASGDRDTICP